MNVRGSEWKKTAEAQISAKRSDILWRWSAHGIEV